MLQSGMRGQRLPPSHVPDISLLYPFYLRNECTTPNNCTLVLDVRDKCPEHCPDFSTLSSIIAVLMNFASTAYLSVVSVSSVIIAACLFYCVWCRKPKRSENAPEKTEHFDTLDAADLNAVHLQESSMNESMPIRSPPQTAAYRSLFLKV